MFERSPFSCSWRVVVRLCLCGLLCAAQLAGSQRADAAKKRTVAVLYFDNNTKRKELDVLQKGFADMMITDLSQVRELQVVEREKLQKLLDELKLQRSKYFNKRTALRLGKGLGARYVVTGSFVAVKPKIRIDMRMIDVPSSKIVLACKVIGKRTDLFKLEQQLVARFVRRLRIAFRPPVTPRTKVPNVKTLLEYSKSIDLADKGKLTAAERRMARVAKRAPTFALAMIRRTELLRRLAQAAKVRSKAIGEQGKQLYRSAAAFIKRHQLKKLDAAQSRHYLAYRVVLGWFTLRALRQYLSKRSPNVILPRKKTKALRLMKAYLVERQRLIADLKVYAKLHTKTFPNGLKYLNTSLRLPAADERRARAAGFGYTSSLSQDLSRAKYELALFLLMGRANDGRRRSLMIAPPLALVLRKYERYGFRLLNQVVADEEAKRKNNPRMTPYRAIRAMVSYGEALLLRGKRAKAIAKWQQILARYPTSSSYKRIERRIKQQLGVVHDATVRRLGRYARGLKGCADMDLRVGLSSVLYRRLRTRGLRGLGETIREIERHCRNKPAARRFFKYLYSHVALSAGRHGDCAQFERLMKRYVKEGGSPRSVKLYRKNLAKCPQP